MRIILLLAGYSQSGKNTIGDWLEANYGFRQYAFADSLKQHVSQKYGFPFVWTQTQEGKKEQVSGTNKTVRDLLIEEGQAIRAKTSPGFFAELVMNKIRTDNTQRCVITDWRLPEELSTIEKQLQLDPITILKKVRVGRLGQLESPVKHWTETSLREIPMDGVIINPGSTLHGLYATVDIFCAQQGISKYSRG
jgi:hypothetical protein